MKHYILSLSLLFVSMVSIMSCSSNAGDGVAFTFDTENIAGDKDEYTRPAVITGQIANRDVYPELTDITISLPFFGRVNRQLTSRIWDDNSFSFEFHPYALRDISLPPFIDRLLVGPGDSLHIEIDFADFSKLSCSGKGSENNEKLHAFHMKYYSPLWPSFSTYDIDGVDETKRKYGSAGEYKAALDFLVDEYMARLQDFVSDEHPSEELVAFCRQEIEADYYSMLSNQIPLYAETESLELSDFFRVADVEHLFDAGCFNSRLFLLVQSISGWILSDMRNGDSLSECVGQLQKSTSNKKLQQMLLTDIFNAELEKNDVSVFEKEFPLFNKYVMDPLLKLSIRDRYYEKKAFIEDPRLLSNSILNGDGHGDGISVIQKNNEGLELLRDIISKNAGCAVYISIGANWCQGTRKEMPFQQKLAEDFADRNLRIVNLYLDEGLNRVDPETGIEDYHLTDGQLFGLDPIFHTGRGIPFYVLIDKDGVIVDYGEHLRPSQDGTKQKISKAL